MLFKLPIFSIRTIGCLAIAAVVVVSAVVVVVGGGAVDVVVVPVVVVAVAVVAVSVAVVAAVSFGLASEPVWEYIENDVLSFVVCKSKFFKLNCENSIRTIFTGKSRS